MKKSVLTPVLILLVSFLFAQDQKDVAQETELKKLSNDWMVAAMKRDQATLDKIVASEFKLGGTKPGGNIISREIWMKNTMENLKIDSINYLKTEVDVIDNVAIVQSTFYWSVSFLGSPAKKDTVDMVDTWIRRLQGWQVVSRLVVD